MSSTILPRNEKRQDFYYTPEWATEALWNEVEPLHRKHEVILDVGAGMGSIGSVLRNRGFTNVTGVEIDPELADVANTQQLAGAPKQNWVHVGDFLRTQYRDVDTIIMNPPYSQAMEFITHAVTLQRAGHVYALLRVGFIGSLRRAAFHRLYPSHMFILPKRPSFTADGKCDSCDYAWFHWHHRIQHGGWSILPLPHKL